MTIEQAQKLQESVAKECIALTAVCGPGVDCTIGKQAVPIIGKAWGIPEEDTHRLISAIHLERAFAEAGASESVYPECELPINPTGSQTLETIWGLFETATRLDTQADRKHLLDTAIEIAQCQNLEDWIRK